MNVDIWETIFLSNIGMTFYISSCHSNLKIGSKYFMCYHWKNSRNLSLVPNCSHSLICHLAKNFIHYDCTLATILITFQFPNFKHLGNLGYHRNYFSTYVQFNSARYFTKWSQIQSLLNYNHGISYKKFLFLGFNSYDQIFTLVYLYICKGQL